MSNHFATLARECAVVLRRVLTGEIKSRGDLELAWPPAAEDFPILDDVRDDVFEYWFLEPDVSYREVIQTSARILENAPDDPHQTADLLQRAIDELP